MSDEIEHDKPDTITRLRDENKRLRAALGDVYNAAGNNHRIANIARAALEGK